jgi:alcohol dehydrogenase class IV
LIYETASDNGIFSLGWLDDIIEILESEDYEYEIYSNINSNPGVEEVMEGLEFTTMKAVM